MIMMKKTIVWWAIILFLAWIGFIFRSWATCYPMILSDGVDLGKCYYITCFFISGFLIPVWLLDISKRLGPDQGE